MCDSRGQNMFYVLLTTALSIFMFIGSYKFNYVNLTVTPLNTGSTSLINGIFFNNLLGFTCILCTMLVPQIALWKLLAQNLHK